MKSIYRIPKRTKTKFRINESVEGETIEQELNRLINNNEGGLSTEQKPMIYLSPEQGVHYATDIRTDRWDKAIEQTERVTNHVDYVRDEKYKKRKEELDKIKNKGKEDEGSNVGNEPITE